MFRKCFSLPVLLAGCVLPALGQGLTSPGGLTPVEVLNGSAKLVNNFDSTQMLRLVVGLTPPNMAAEEQFLQELQTKSSPNFHKFLTADEWNARFSPSVQDEQAVVDWATSQGLTISHRYPNRLTITLEGNTATIEKAFGLQINNYQLGTKTFFSNNHDPVIPSKLSKIVHSVGGLNSLQVLRPAHKGVLEPEFPIYSPDRPNSQAPQEGRADSKGKPPASVTNGKTPPPITGGAYDPTDVYSSQAYDLNALNAQGHCCNPLGNAGGTPPATSIAIATAGAQQNSDFIGFHNQYPYLAMHWFYVYVDGTPSCCDGEGTMDFEWSTAWANSFGSYADTASVFMYDGVNNSFSTFTDVYQRILNDGNARIFSTSWGCEEIYCTPTSVMDTDHAIFNSMAGQGWTMVAATGDQGATAGCGDRIAVQYPASDPNIVGAGGTTMSLSTGPIFNYQVAWSGGPYGCGSNDGGSTGGVSAYYGVPSYQSGLGYSARAVPDIALNADWYNTPQNLYFSGSLSGNGGTSIVAPEMAGFFAQSNAYLAYLSTTISGGLCNGHSCGPLGNGNYYLYYFGKNPSYAPHYPYYDITSGCNNNDVTSFYGLGYWCTVTGYDPVTGWGSFNALQLAWAINTYQAGDFGSPYVNFSGPSTGVWYNADQTVSFTAGDTGTSHLPATGISGVSYEWDADPGDVFRESIPGTGNSFYSGPWSPRSSSGSFDLAGAGQGCHYANVRAWDNSGFGSGDYTYGPVCYDTIAPVTTGSLAGTLVSGIYQSNVTVTLTATDTGSGVYTTYYQPNTAGWKVYSGPFVVTKLGADMVQFYSEDNAGNFGPIKTKTFTINSKTTTTLASSKNPSVHGSKVTFTATVLGTLSGTPTGTVTFKQGTTTLGTGTINSATHQAKFTTATLTTGTHNITAVYAAQGNFYGSTSAVLKQVVQ
jgi:kumamolisin